MTAPVLSPTERDETTRFGIHDPEAFERIVESFDDVVPCVATGCDSTATTFVAMRCCGSHWLSCDEHFAAGSGEAEEYLLKLLLFGKIPTCAKCGHKFPYGCTFEDIYRVVPL